jgi:hypothetical protein
VGPDSKRAETVDNLLMRLVHRVRFQYTLLSGRAGRFYIDIDLLITAADKAGLPDHQCKDSDDYY